MPEVRIAFTFMAGQAGDGSAKLDTKMDIIVS